MSDEEYKVIFSNNLKKYMEINQKTQMDLVNDLNLSSSTVSNWCTGLKLPRMNKVQMLADYLHIQKSDLIEEKKEIQKQYYLNEETSKIAQEIFENEDLRILFDATRKAKPEDIRFAAEMLKKLKAKEENY